MMTLSGSVFMMMLVSVFFFVPAPVTLGANISAPLAKFESKKIPTQESESIDELFATLQKHDPKKAQEIYEILTSQKFMG